jgi:erythromycin esterase-like protein/predicted phosphoribosyltransferase
MRRFRDRQAAGRLLAQELRDYAGRDAIVLALPPGGVPVAAEVARELDLSLDAIVVRKLGIPGENEVGFGAVASGGIRVLNAQLVKALGIPLDEVDAISARAAHEVERRDRAYRGERAPPDLTGRTVILVADGLASPFTVRAAVHAVRVDEPAQVVVAAPVAATDLAADLRTVADAVVTLREEQPLRSVSAWYDDYPQLAGDEVRELLARGHRPPPEPDYPMRTLTGASGDYDPLIERAAGLRFVLLGEASHGTHEFYRERAEITRRLIVEAGFTAVAVEADWPDADRVNRFVRGDDGDATPAEALDDFRRFPAWMWRNTDVEQFVGWLREHNGGLGADAPKVGFHGLDLYSLHRSMSEVIAYLEGIDPEAAERARERYSCFDHFGPDPQVYAYEAGMAGAEPCEQQAIVQLRELQERLVDHARAHGVDEDRRFYAVQNARLVVNAEAYYRAAFRGGAASWNLRDRHMAETLYALAEHLEAAAGNLDAGGEPVRIVVWAHNSHLGDARATEMGDRGELNLGQLVRERSGEEALLVGQTTYTGTVTAATNWGGPAERKPVRRSLTGSWEEEFHRRGADRFLLETAGIAGRRLERAIGVIYRPETERISHYFHARLADQFDVILHYDETSALEPLDVESERAERELPETYPTGV